MKEKERLERGEEEEEGESRKRGAAALAGLLDEAARKHRGPPLQAMLEEAGRPAAGSPASPGACRSDHQERVGAWFFVGEEEGGEHGAMGVCVWLEHGER
jgi:hypothetical protein